MKLEAKPAQLARLVRSLLFVPLYLGCGGGVNASTIGPSTGGAGTSAVSADPTAGAASIGGKAATGGTSSNSSKDRADIGAIPFDPNAVLEYRITMAPELYKEMKEHGDDEAYREASLEVLGESAIASYSAIGIRYKGDYSLHHCWEEHGGVRSYTRDCAHLSVKLKFNAYDEHGRFSGLKLLNLHAMSSDNTKLRERVVYSVFNEFGVATARAVHAKLRINDEVPVLVLAVEQIDGRLTAFQEPAGGDGDLYEDIWPAASTTESVLREQLRTNDGPEDSPDFAAFLNFTAAVINTTEATFSSDMSGFVDLDHLMRYMAVDRAFKNWDGFTAFYWPDRPHNFYWYHETSASNRFRLIPWDLDKTVWEYDPYMEAEGREADRVVPNWNVKPKVCDRISVWHSSGEITVMPPGCDKFTNLLAATQWDRFVAIGNELLNTRLRYEELDAKVTTWAQQIAPIVDEDPVLDLATWESEVKDFRAILQKSIDDFRNHLSAGYIVEP